MTQITIHLDEATEARMRAISAELQRDIWELATSAVAEAALDYFRPQHRAARDPARLPATSEGNTPDVRH